MGLILANNAITNYNDFDLTVPHNSIGRPEVGFLFYDNNNLGLRRDFLGGTWHVYPRHPEHGWPGGLVPEVPEQVQRWGARQDRAARNSHRRHEVLPGWLQQRVQGLRQDRDHELRSLHGHIRIVWYVFFLKIAVYLLMIAKQNK